ncbi:hypothetical protein [Pectobacterium phage Wc4-1]|uniref:Uncharacterized protein n=1 Tax=Pectobacterium phage Wc4 TaxID=2652428 RepID=A0A5P8D491_9CAUD|nr:hypothetical protein [Pectobacterium phage Wc4]QFP94042.1 hypothetical protein [Pectobacterium phage Wc4-1]
MKLTMVLINEPSDIFLSKIHREVVRDFENIFSDDFEEGCKEIPRFSVTWFYKKLVGWFEYHGDYYVFISCTLQQQELGRIEHCIYSLTGRRGVGNHIDQLEFIGRPNVPMKKFLNKRF